MVTVKQVRWRKKLELLDNELFRLRNAHREARRHCRILEEQLEQLEAERATHIVYSNGKDGK